MQAYTNEEYRSLLTESGFGNVVFYPSLADSPGSLESHLIAILAQKNVA
jgi:hypothetical protein